MNSRVKKLVDAGMFRSPKLNKLGHGTFLDVRKAGKTPNNFIEQAKDLKKEADSAMPQSRSGGIRMYMKTIFLYIRGYKAGDKRHGMVDAIHMWKELGKYVESIIKLLRTDEEKQVGFFRLVLFNIKFYYLHLENSLVAKQHDAEKGREGTQLLYFLRQYSNLHEMFEVSGIKNFCVVNPCDLEDFIMNNTSFMEMDG